MQVSQLADAVKYTSVGITFGVAAGGAVNFLADEVVKAMELKGHDPASSFAELLVRASLGGVGLVLASRVVTALGTDDPTDGSYFQYGFGTAQLGLYDVTVRISHMIRSGMLLGVEPTSDKPCCGSCASGSSCESGH